MRNAAEHPDPPHVPDYELVRSIGSGSYGEVWLARNVFGVYRAVKIVRRSSFDNERPFQREFKGIQSFEPVSRSHPGLIAVLHAGQNEAEGYFYYAMELADDPETGQQIVPERYQARTLSSEIARHGRVPLQECIQIGLTISDALSTLHGAGLAHRDIKPSNIIFVNGNPKLADIGLVHTMARTATFVGTQGYIAPEGPGTAQSDIFALGKVLYELSTGNDRQQFPELPEFLNLSDEAPLFRELNEVLIRACDADPRRRYQSAKQLKEDLEVIGHGGSLRRLRVLERRFKLATRITVAAVGLGLAAAAIGFSIFQAHQRAERARAGESAIALSYGSRFVAEDDPLRALPWFLKAAEYDDGSAENATTHRVRIGAMLEYGPRLTHCWWQPAGIIEAFFSPDGRTIAAGDNVGKIRLLDSETGRVLAEMAHATNQQLYSLDWSPDSRLLVSGGGNGRALLWSVPDGAPAGAFPLPDNWVETTRFSPGGDLVAVGGMSGFLALCDVKTRAIRPLNGHRDDIRSASFSPDGKRLVSASHDGNAIVWNVADGTEIFRLTHPKGTYIYDAAFSPDNRWIVTGSHDRLARIYDASTGSPAFPPLRHEMGVGGIQFSPDARYLITGTYGSEVDIWDITRDFHRVCRVHAGAMVWRPSFSPDGRSILTASVDATIRRWELAPASIDSAGTHDRVCASGARLFCVESNTITIASPLASPAPREREPMVPAGATNPDPDHGTSFPCPYATEALVLNRSGTMFLALPRDKAANKTIQGLDVEKNAPLQALNASTEIALTSCSIADRAAVAVSFRGNQLQAWNLQTGAETLRWTNRSRLTGAAISPDGTRAAGFSDYTVYLFDLRAGPAPIATLPHALNIIPTAVFTSDSRRILTACRDDSQAHGYAQLWDAATGKPVGPRFDHDDGVMCVAFSPDGKLVATGGEEYMAKIWDLATGRVLSVIHHDEQVISVEFSEDSRWLVTGSRDFTAGIWEVKTGSPITPPLRHINYVVKARLAPGGRVLITTADASRTLPLPEKSPDSPELSVVAPFLAGGTVPAETDRRRIAEWLAGVRSRAERIPDVDWQVEQARRSERANPFGAVFHIERAARLDPDRPDIQASLARLHAKLSR